MNVRIERVTAALGDRYEVVRELGSGGTATVFLANDTRYKRRVAVKVFRPEVAEALGQERFVREITLVATLSHPHIIPLLDSGDVDGLMFYVMPAIEGETLRERMTRLGMFPIDDALQIARDVAVALDYAHGRDVVHRDIKPENILLTAGTAVVLDFGIAKMLNATSGGNSLTRAGVAVGTVMYMSPEQASAGPVDGRTDIYALGCVLFEMLAGRPPFIGTSTRAVVVSHFTDPVPSLHHLRAEVAQPIEAVISKALAKSPDERFATAREFTDELAKARRAASREHMWRALGGTSPPPKSGEWHGKREFNVIAAHVAAAEAAAAEAEAAAAAAAEQAATGEAPAQTSARRSVPPAALVGAAAVVVALLAWLLLR